VLTDSANRGNHPDYFDEPEIFKPEGYLNNNHHGTKKGVNTTGFRDHLPFGARRSSDCCALCVFFCFWEGSSNLDIMNLSWRFLSICTYFHECPAFTASMHTQLFQVLYEASFVIVFGLARRWAGGDVIRLFHILLPPLSRLIPEFMLTHLIPPHRAHNSSSPFNNCHFPHQAFVMGVDLLDLAPVPGLIAAAVTLLNVWVALQKVDVHIYIIWLTVCV
jgi:hypothetical protein